MTNAVPLGPRTVAESDLLGFFKAEPLTKYKPGVFDDGQVQKNYASFLKAFLNQRSTMKAHKGEAVYINRFAKKRPASRSYGCSK